MKELVNNISEQNGRSVFMTVHFNDKEFNYTGEELRQKFTEMKKLGIDAIRFDFRINQWKEQGQSYEKKTMDMIGIAVECSLEIFPIISSPVDNKLPDKTEIQNIRRIVTLDGAVPIPKVQVLNEWNNRIYTPAKTIANLPGMIRNVREVFGPETKIYATLFLGTTFHRVVNSALGVAPFERFVVKHSTLISLVDYYPNTWQLTLKKSFNIKHEDHFNLQRLTSALTLVTNKFPKLKIDLGELGAASFIPGRIGEIRQAWIFTSFMRLLVANKIFDRFNISTIGLYIAESPKTGEAVPNVVNFGMLYTADRRPTELNKLEKRQKLKISFIRLVAKFLVMGKITLSNDEMTNRQDRKQTLIATIIQKIKAPSRGLYSEIFKKKTIKRKDS